MCGCARVAVMCICCVCGEGGVRHTAVAQLHTVVSNVAALPSILPLTPMMAIHFTRTHARTPHTHARTPHTSAGNALQPVTLLKQLLLSVLIPTMAGVAIRTVVPGVKEWVDHNRKILAYFSTLCLGSVPWMQVCVCVCGCVCVWVCVCVSCET